MQARGAMLSPICLHASTASTWAGESCGLRDRLLDVTTIALRDELKEDLFIDGTVSVNIRDSLSDLSPLGSY
ncbi:hypothetical protein K466DRAFT_171944 [Polyporus arcularius HHB13444]|uniref:Uncharacterized protein n=1 Tax=Polyporus arcularius HHB13444 TaxID=1314778 RepID=A0A5C3PJ13_9APHY|nr:hypothetical protein K466DRAFT_171944 [Polyporus arcularius HHB13444]